MTPKDLAEQFEAAFIGFNSALQTQADSIKKCLESMEKLSLHFGICPKCGEYKPNDLELIRNGSECSECLR